MNARTFALVLLLLLSAALPAASPHDPAEDSIRAVATGFVDAWNRHDMKALAGLFADDADFVNVIGMWWRGREEIRKQHEAIHATRMKDSVLKELDASVRILSPDVAVVRQHWELSGDTGIEGKPLPPRGGLLLYVLERDRDAWRIIAAQNTDIVPIPNVPTPK